MAVALCSGGIAGGPHPGCTVSSREFGGGEAPTRGRGSCAGKEAGHQGRGLPVQRQTPGRRLCLEPQVLQAAGRGLAGPLGVRAALLSFLSSHGELLLRTSLSYVGITPQPLATRSLLSGSREFTCSGRSTGAVARVAFCVRLPWLSIMPSGSTLVRGFHHVSTSFPRPPRPLGGRAGSSVRGVCCGHRLGVVSAVA